MKVFLIDKNKITKFKLPKRVDDMYMLHYVSDNVNCYITFVGKDNKWYIKSNGNVNVIENNTEIEEKEIKICEKYNIKIVGYPEIIDLFFLPATETLFKLDFNGLKEFSIGTDQSCNFSFKSPYISPVQAIIKIIDNEWVVATIDNDEYKTFVNDNRIKSKKLNFGDIIFMGGLRLVWMNKIICVNNPNNNLQIRGLSLIKDEKKDEIELLPVSEEEKAINLYTDDDYYAPYPIIREKIDDCEITIDDPPKPESMGNTPWFLTIGSTLIMAASAFVMAYNVGYSLYNNSDIFRVIPQIILCFSMLIGSILIPVLTRRYQKKAKIQREENRIKKYNEYLDSIEVSIEEFIKDEINILNQNYLTTDKCIQAIINKNNDFWKWQITDEEYLNVFLGIGRRKSKLIINTPAKKFSLDNDNLLQRVYEIKNKYQYIDNAPITISLRQNPIVSMICNDENSLEDYINQILLQLIALHNSIDLKIVLFTKSANEKRWEFLKYIPHIFSDDKSIRFFATNADEIKNVSGFLEEVLKSRKEQYNNIASSENVVPVPYYIVITDNYKKYKNIPIIEDMVNENLSKYSFLLIDIEMSTKNVPLSSKTFINFGSDKGAVMEKQYAKDNQIIFNINKLDMPLNMRALALKLANIPVLTKEGMANLPDTLTFLDMFKVSKIEQLNIINRWQNNDPVASLDTVVGVHANGDDFKLDLHEKFHGPHGLVAGSTGSGKSEFIITYILSMIINYHPYEVQFVLIDYKGGGLAGAFENKETGVKIPHLVGTITNLNISEMNRSLISLQSELNRRQALFNEVRDKLNEGTVDIYKYQKFYREGRVEKPLSHLFIICDEFAELKSQRPEFMSQLISISRIGRSLGIHLILATQKPSGQVNEQIWANSKFKVCFKVQDRQDSMEMLKRPEAAELKNVGRFYLQIGYNDYFDIGQSGYSGAKYIPSDKILTKIDESINYINNIGYVVKTIKDDDNNSNNKNYGDQVTNIVKYVYETGKKENIVTQKLWLDPIPEIIYDKELKQKYNYKPTPYYINPVIGEYDDPVNQYQNILNVDLSKKGNLLIYGQAGSGKEFLLTSLIYSTIIEHTPNEVSIYILDCGAETLKIFTNFPHIGDVVTIQEADKIYDYFEFANKEIEKRKKLFTDYAGSYNDYITNSGKKLPLLIFIINNYDNFQEGYSKLSEMIIPLFRDGFKYGVVFIVTANSVNTIRARVAQFFENKICLQLPDNSNYREILGCPKELIPEEIYGRGIIGMNSTGYEFQTLSFTQRSNQTNYLRSLSKLLNQAYTYKAQKIPTVPSLVTVDNLSNNIISSTMIPIGYDIDKKEIFHYNFNISKITPIISIDINDNEMAFIYALIELLNMQLNVKLEVVDFVDAYITEIMGVKPIKDNYENAFVKIYNEIVSNDNKLEKYYFILGISFLKEKISEDLYNKFVALIENIDKYNVHIIIIDVYNGIKQLDEKWFTKITNSNNCIWLGKGAWVQPLFKINNIKQQDKELNFPYMGVIINNNRYQIIKYVVKRMNDNEK